MSRVAIGLGSNQGDRAANLAAGRNSLAARGVIWRAVSQVYETEPVLPDTSLPTEQGAYLNQVAVGETELSPQALLEVCLGVEQQQGRVRTVRWGPRTLDLDVLLYDDRQIEEPGLIVPHPEMTRRAFVLIPLAEATPDWPVPGTGKTAAELAATAPGREGVRVWRSSAMKPPM